MSQAHPPPKGLPIKGNRSLLSSANIRKAMPVCFVLLRHLIWIALALAFDKEGRRMAAKIAMMAITTSSSMRVNPLLFREFGIVWRNRLIFERDFTILARFF